MGREYFLKPDDAIVTGVTQLFRNKVNKIEMEGKAYDISGERRVSSVYNVVFFKLMELMIMDVIEGNLVYFHKATGAKFSVHDWLVHSELIEGKGIHDNMMTPLVDLKVTGYKMPVIVFDPGYKNSALCKVFIPQYLYSMLVHKVNEGKKYFKSNKKLWYEK